MAVRAQSVASDVRRYYDRHTAAFVRFGQGGGFLHRAVWGPGVTTREQAFRYVEEQIARLVETTLSSSRLPHVVDLGCGVGASLCHLAERVPLTGTGITLSPVQADMARKRVAAAGLSDRVECLEGDYCDLPSNLAPADLAYAIESFVHGPAPERFFEQCSRLVRPGGLLVVCDDVRRQEPSPEATRVIEQFRRGWHVNSLIARQHLLALAGAAGFEHESTSDLTPYLEIHRVRDRLLGVILALLEWAPLVRRRFDYVLGGRALQACLKRGWIGYEITVLRRRGGGRPPA